MQRIAFVSLVIALTACSKAPDKTKPAPATSSAGTVNPDGSRTIPIAVKKAGYQPDSLQAKPNEQLHLVFTRVEATECGAQVKVDGGKLYDLPMNQPVDVAVTAPASGKIQFACGMDMMSGVIVVGS